MLHWFSEDQKALDGAGKKEMFVENQNNFLMKIVKKKKRTKQPGFLGLINRTGLQMLFLLKFS